MGQKYSVSTGGHSPTQNYNTKSRLSTLQSSVSQFAHNKFHKTYRKVLILSLDAAGKTSILYWFKHRKLLSTIPTIGYNHESLSYKTSKFDFWDIGGQSELREYWSNYFINVQAIIFVIDSNDRERISEAKSVLHWVEKLLFESDNPNSHKVVLLVLANKQDLVNAMSREEVYDRMKLQNFRGLRTELLTCCTKTGAGLLDALERLHVELKKRF